MVQPDPQKRPRPESSDNVPSSVGPFRDDISLAPSFTQSTSSRRSSSPTRVKAQLATATPKVVVVHGSADPGCREAKSFLSFLTSEDSTSWQANTDLVKKISSASSRFATELRSEGSWVRDVVRPLLEAAIGDLPLESWSVQTESVYPKYLPPYTAKDTFNRKIDLVIGLPKEAWKEEYERAGIDTFGRDLSHVDHPHTGEGLLGLGVEVKPLDGNLIEAQVQLAVWIAGLMSWAYSSRHHDASNVSPPPIVGCTVIGEDWKFYIIHSVASASPQLSKVVCGRDVRVVCPLADLLSGFGAPFRLLKAKPWMNVASLFWARGSVELCNISAPHVHNSSSPQLPVAMANRDILHGIMYLL